MKCDFCNQASNKIKKFNRAELRNIRRWKEKDEKDKIHYHKKDLGNWKNDKYKAFDNISGRKIRICKQCLDEFGLDKEARG